MFFKSEQNTTSISQRAYSSADLLVWAVWATLLASLLVCIALYAHNVPLAEDWQMVAPLTGHEPNLLSWLWSQNNEHRLPLPRLIHLGLLLATRDFRAGMVASTLITAAVSLALVLRLRKLRGGRARYTDALIPILFLHLGNWYNLLWSWQLGFVISTALVSVFF